MTLRVGDTVVTRRLNPPGHTRLAQYLCAKPGRIEAIHGSCPVADDPDGCHHEPLYTVAFASRDVWGANAEPNCVVHAELWESYFSDAALINRSDVDERGKPHDSHGGERQTRAATVSDHDHDHDHDHGGGTAAALTQRVNALIATLERANVTSNAEVTGTLERFLAAAGPWNGAAIVARAWSDAAFKDRLLTHPNAAIAELGIDLTLWAPVQVRVVENTALVHNVVVCTLCSCYPIALLGPSPAWYRSEAYRSRVVREPRAVLAAFGCPIADDVQIRVWDSSAELRYFVLPQRPVTSRPLSEAQLATLVSRDALIGVAKIGLPAED